MLNAIQRKFIQIKTDINMVKEATTPPPVVEETTNGGVAVTRQLRQSFIQVLYAMV